MTTIKEYKSLMEGATDAPWVLEKGVIKSGKQDFVSSFYHCKQAPYNAAFVAASRSIAPELIRVIELAEEALKFYCRGRMSGDTEYAREALSEIRKLKGE